MIDLIRAARTAATIAAMALMLAAAPTLAHAQTGVVHLRIVKAGFVVGVGGGDGALFYHGHRYRLSVAGVGIGSLGIASARMTGTAYNLARPEDIVGTYGAAGAGGTFVGGAAVARLKNEKGVVLELHGVQMGFQVSLGLAGMAIGLK